MTILIKHEEIRDFQQLVKAQGIRHGPFRKSWRGYDVDILESGPLELYLRLKYSENQIS